MMNPRISVIVPVYNASSTLNRCVDSVLAQTFHDFELILVDDGSQDCSGVICDRYAEIDKRVHVIHQKNSGVSVARNAALDIARGEWLTFLDSDDYLSPNYLEPMIHDNNYDVIVLETKKVLTSGTVVPYCRLSPCCSDDIMSYHNILSETLHEELLRGVAGKLFRTCLLSSIRFNVCQRIGEDTLYMMEAFKRCSSICVLNDYIYYVQLGEVHYRNKYKLSVVDAISGAQNIFEKYFMLDIDSVYFERLIYKFFFSLIDREEYCSIKAWFENPILDRVASKLSAKGELGWKFMVWKSMPTLMYYFEPRYDKFYISAKSVVKTILGRK